MIVIYTKNACTACQRTKADFKKFNIPYEERSLHELSVEEMNDFLDAGLTAAPIIDTGTERWAGYQPERIKTYEQLPEGDTTSV